MDELHELIKALSASEKRYFKRFSKQHTGKTIPKYIILFDAYDSMEKFDPDALKDLLQDDRILRFINQEKKYLKEKILEAMRNYRGTRTINGKLYRLLEEREILVDMGLYKQGNKRLNTIRKLARQHDKFSILLQVLAIEQKRFLEYQISLPANQKDKVWQRLEDEIQEVIGFQQTVAAYRKAFAQILAIYRRDGSPESLVAEDQANIEEIKHLPIFTDSSKADSFFALHLYRLTTSIIYQLEGNFDDASEVYTELIQMWEERPDRRQAEPIRYLLVLSNFLNVQHLRGDYHDFPLFLDKIRNFEMPNFNSQAEQFQNVAQLELLAFINQGILETSEVIYANFTRIQQYLIEGLEKYHEKINASRLLILYYNTMLSNFILGNVKDTKIWMRKIEQSGHSKKVRREVQHFCKVIELIVFFQQEEYGLILAYYRNNYRSLQRAGRLHDVYQIVIDTINRLAGAALNKERNEIFRQGMKQLGALPDKVVNSCTGGHELQLWIQARAEGRSYLEVIQEDIRHQQMPPANSSHDRSP